MTEDLGDQRDDSNLQGPASPDPDAWAIANGHAATDHAGDFPSGMTATSDERAAEVQRVMNVGERLIGENSREAYIDWGTGRVVVYDPNSPDKGTYFAPDDVEGFASRFR